MDTIYHMEFAGAEGTLMRSRIDADAERYLAGDYTRIVVMEPDGAIRAATSVEIDAIAAEHAAQQAAQQTAELHEAYQQIGASVTAIRAFLVALNLGYDLPCDSATVMADLTTKALTGQLTAAQRDAKNDLADLYLMLRGSGVTDSQIAAMWDYIKAGGE